VTVRELSYKDWVTAALGSLLLLAVTTLAGLDRARIAGDAAAALQIAQRADKEQALLRAEMVGDLKEVRAQLAEIRKHQDALLDELRRRR
jgi:hypothetical protein